VGTEIKTLQDMQFVRVDQEYQGHEVLVYHRKGDDLQLNGIPISVIEYRFCAAYYLMLNPYPSHSNFMLY